MSQTAQIHVIAHIDLSLIHILYGMEGTHFHHIFVEDTTDLDVELARQNMVDVAQRVVIS